MRSRTQQSRPQSGMVRATMSGFEGVLMRTFGRPAGILSRLGGMVMARMNRPCAAWTIDLLKMRGDDRILEIGFGPGVGIQLLAEVAPAGHVDGIDPSQEMVGHAHENPRMTNQLVRFAPPSSYTARQASGKDIGSPLNSAPGDICCRDICLSALRRKFDLRRPPTGATRPDKYRKARMQRTCHSSNPLG